jgi:hypothetical protein
VEKKGSRLAVFEGVELNRLCLKINLGARRHSKVSLHREKNIRRALGLILDNKLPEVWKRRVPVWPFLKELS